MARGRRWDFQQRNAGVDDPSAKHRDMKVQRRDIGGRDGLPVREHPLHLIEHVISESDDRAVSPFDSETDDAGGRCHTRNGRAALDKRQQLTVDGKPRAVAVQRRVSMPRVSRDAVASVGALGFGTVDDEESRLDVRNAVSGGDNDIIGATRLAKLPRGLEELEELFNGRDLPWFGDDSDHARIQPL
jgi:hypothetical protein